jgi:hypothetical protein
VARRAEGAGGAPESMMKLNFVLTRRREDTKEGRRAGAVSLEDLKVEGGEIDDPTSPRLRRTRLMIFDIGLLTFLKKGRESRCLGGWGFLLVMGSDQ